MATRETSVAWKQCCELGTLGPAAAAPGLKWFKMRPHHQQQHSSSTTTLALSPHLRGVHDERCLLNILADTEEGEEADPAPITAQYCHGLGQSELSIHLHSSVSRPSMKLMETVLGATATDTVLHSSRSVFSIICSRRVVLG